MTAGTVPSWPGPLPSYGPGRLAAIRGLRATIAADCWKSLASMVADGWDVIDAVTAYEAWIVDLVRDGMAQAVREWREGIAA